MKATGIPVEKGSGGLTKFNRTIQNLEKTHWIDAGCVGKSTPEKLNIKGVKVLTIKAAGHGSRQSCGTDKFGFPIGILLEKKCILVFRLATSLKHLSKRVKR